MQVGDPLARVDHRQRRARRVDRVEVGLDRGTLAGRQALDLAVDVTDAVVGIDAERLEDGRMLVEDVLVGTRGLRVRT